MRLIVTGAAGFIGSNLIAALNARGYTEIIAVDSLLRSEKLTNLSDLEIGDFVDKQDFIGRLKTGAYGRVDAIFHQGACSDTMESNGRYMMQNNYEYSLTLLDWCDTERVPFIYASSASVYGGGSVFVEDRRYERPLNVYAYSKFLFDQRVRRRLPDARSQIAGFRYFNVYGPRETHKGRMASVAFHHFHQFRQEGHVRLFDGYDGYAAGEQRRDFIHVDDVVNVNLWFFEHPERSGIFNVGTGRAQSFNEVGQAVVEASSTDPGQAPQSLARIVERGLIRYVPFPDALKGKYQSYTQADITRLRQVGYEAPFLTVQEGVKRYVEKLSKA